MKKTFKTAFDNPVRVSFKSDLPSRTKQQFAAEANINNLIDRYKNTGAYYSPLSMMNNGRGAPSYEDISGLSDVAEAIDTVRKAGEIFASLPSQVRLQFGNNPAAFVAWSQNPANLKHLAALGVVDLPRELIEGDKKPVPTAPAAAPEQHKPTATAGSGSEATVISPTSSNS